MHLSLNLIALSVLVSNIGTTLSKSGAESHIRIPCGRHSNISNISLHVFEEISLACFVDESGFAVL